MKITVLKKVLEANDTIAGETRDMLHRYGARMVNIIGPPGCGKTTLIEGIIGSMRDKYSIAVIEGDIETTIDAEKLAKYDIPVVQINTSTYGGECHLGAAPVRQALDSIDLKSIDLVLVENVGNLVCPAEFEIGEDAKIAILSVTDGEDKPLKYPLLFIKSRLLLLNKRDLLPHLEFNENLFLEALNKVNPSLQVIRTSGKTGEGIEEIVGWLSGLFN